MTTTDSDIANLAEKISSVICRKHITKNFIQERKKLAKDTERLIKIIDELKQTENDLRIFLEHYTPNTQEYKTLMKNLYGYLSLLYQEEQIKYALQLGYIV